MNLRLNWMNYVYLPYDGYGLFGLNMILALASQGVDVMPLEKRDALIPGWMQHLRGIDWGRLNIMLMPPYEMPDLPGRSWAFTMTEGYYLSREWVRPSTTAASGCWCPANGWWTSSANTV